MAETMREQQQYRHFYDLSMKTLLQLHPHVSEKMFKNMGDQSMLEGFVRAVRQRDAVDVGLIA